MLYKIISLFFIAASICSCVSIGVEEPKISRAADVKYQIPMDFINIEQDHVDKAWKNAKNGNAISYLSECGTSMDLSHAQIRDGILIGIHNKNLLEEKMIDFNNRKALSTLISGTVDGIDIKTEVLILKKNNCTYILTYVGLKSEFHIDNSAFKRFLKEFTVP